MSVLPKGFEALLPFVDGWALDTAYARSMRRSQSTPDERQAFYDAMSAHLPEALARLDDIPLDQHDPAHKRLMLLCLALAHVAHAIEEQAEDEIKHAPHRDQMIITRAPADA